ncbi:ribosome biogenesis regulatory protein homolog [Daktulosphaira vitifoliae]|uniref:ribosome biogenesis regulatory protein homolog n=1 Tax=Daktulosphaira vitifoliae TaxID=58002 RepID=UPI0021AA4D70|nr:ribosome biogenesis regulatory protein homolog [Daktulosphaira vitifoliae]XP_050523563.1 ribosome biogenesis regulatory protein homolog [Daktulosphaira vitifoliae]
MENITELLNQKAAKDEASLNSVTVTKVLEPEIDLGTLLCFDSNDFDTKQLRSDQESYLTYETRNNVQLLINKLFELPMKTEDGYMYVDLPEPRYNLPREKPLPAPKPLTKWQKFAIEKGIKKTPKPKKTWDDILQKWVPTYGYKKAAAEKEKDWILEVPGNAPDPNIDLFAQKREAKKERVAKNEYQRLRNIAASRKIKVPAVGLPPLEGTLHSNQLKTAVDVARISTASVGKFQPKLKKEDLSKKKSIPGLKKEKVPAKSMNEEKQNSLQILETINNKKPKFNLEKAANKAIYEEETQRFREKNSDDKKKGGRGRSKSSFKRPTANKGKRMGKQKGGRKRR